MALHAPLNEDRIQQRPGLEEPHLTQPDHRLRNVENVLQNLVDAQVKVARSREALIIERERLRTLSSKVRQKRVEAGNAEAAFMSQLRIYINDTQPKIPSALIDAYSNVENLRNDLGVLEEEFLDAERKLSGMEWRFQNDENEFYQFDLSDALEELESEAASIPHCGSKGVSTPVPSATFLSPSTPPNPVLSTSQPGRAPVLSQQRSRPLPPLPPPPPSALPRPLSSASHLTGEAKLIKGPEQSSPPLVILQSPSSDSSASSKLEDRNYEYVMAELKNLRRDFITLRKMRADESDTIDTHLALLDDECETNPYPIGNENIIEIFEEQPYFGMLRQISECEVEARSLKNEAMFRDIQSLNTSRRCSDPGPTSTLPAPSVCMNGTLTEGAFPIFSDFPRVEGWLRKWLLQQFQDDPLRQQLYRDISLREGLESPNNGSWEDRAVFYWDKDHASDYDTQLDEGDDEANENVLTRDTSHEQGVDGSSMPFTRIDGHHPYSVSRVERLDTKLEGNSHIAQPRTTSLPTRTKLPSPLSSSPITISKVMHSNGIQECSLISPPRDEQLYPYPMTQTSALGCQDRIARDITAPKL
jgi:hypothetical protein